MNAKSYENRQKYSITQDSQLHEDFKDYCREAGVTMSDAIEWFAAQLITGKTTINKREVREAFVDYLIANRK